MEASPSVPVREGDVLAAKYRVERVLGAGGMGVVVAAKHLQLDQIVALKFLLPEVTQLDEALQRFHREARAAVRLRGEHVARVLDVGTLENGAPYIVMEYLEGGDLGAVVRSRGALPAEEAIEYVLQACEALAEAHSLGIVHRDLKPTNLFLTRRPDGSPAIKVLDFGISKASGLGGLDVGMTKTSTLMGSPLYMSPEQMRSAKDVDARADVWGLGVILYELLTGQVPFEGNTVPEVCAAVLAQPPRAIESLRADLPADLRAAVERALTKDRDARFANVAELAAAIAPFAPPRAQGSAARAASVLKVDVATTAMRAQAPAAVAPNVAASTAVAWTDSETLPRRRRGPILVAIVAGVLAACAAVGVIAVVTRKPAAAFSWGVVATPTGPASAPSAAALPAPSPAVDLATSASAGQPPPAAVATTRPPPTAAPPGPRPGGTARPGGSGKAAATAKPGGTATPPGGKDDAFGYR